MHPRNKNIGPYDLDQMVMVEPLLESHIIINPAGNKTINFSDPTAVKRLNKAILKHYYNISYWEFPDANLCPGIPGRANYIHIAADILKKDNQNKIPTGDKVKCLDIGTGATCIYPLIGTVEYGWSFIGTEVDKVSLQSAKNIISKNEGLSSLVSTRLQKKPNSILKNIINKDELIDITICNPPFHSNKKEAAKAASRKLRNLKGKKSAPLNFSGNNNELVFEGGELKFISKMIEESRAFANQVRWFTTLVSKEKTLNSLTRLLEKYNPQKVNSIPTGTGNKKSRILAWTYMKDSKRIHNID